MKKVCYFPVNSYFMMRDYRTNAAMLDALDSLLRIPAVASSIDTIEIIAGCSPSGDESHNEQLAWQRAMSMRTYLRWKHLDIAEKYPLHIIPVGIDRAGYKALKNGGLNLSEGQIRNLLQYATVRLKMTDGSSIHPGMDSPDRFLFDNAGEFFDEAVTGEEELELESEPELVPDGAISVLTPGMPYFRRPLFALRTNLLYGATLTPNLAIEIPLGSRWSISVEALNAWWLNHDDTRCWELASLGIETRYWLGNRSQPAAEAYRRSLTGWFVGALAFTGVYDFQLQFDSGRQGKYMAAGLAAGYALRLGSSPWGLEFSVGGGFLSSRYTPYTPDRNIQHELWRTGPDKRFTGFVPLKAGISLVYLFGHKEKPDAIYKEGGSQ
ncbi:MAG: DUF3575 domain-containing protein [Prevotella sp.]|nr:DUF3575 domain-containing protein [Prevotella sp.]